MASRFEELSVFDLEGLDFPTDRRRIAVDALLQSSAVRENRKAPNIVAADDSSVAKLKARAARQKVRSRSFQARKSLYRSSLRQGSGAGYERSRTPHLQDCRR